MWIRFTIQRYLNASKACEYRRNNFLCLWAVMFISKTKYHIYMVFWIKETFPETTDNPKATYESLRTSFFTFLSKRCVQPWDFICRPFVFRNNFCSSKRIRNLLYYTLKCNWTNAHSGEDLQKLNRGLEIALMHLKGWRCSFDLEKCHLYQVLL